MHYYGIRSTENQYFFDGMQIRDVENFPVRILDSYSLYTTSAPIGKGFSAGAITNFSSIGGIDKLMVIAEVNTDLAYDMQGFNGEMVIGIPLASKERIANGKKFASLLVAAKYASTNNTDPIWKETSELSDEALSKLFSNPLRETGYGHGTYANSDFLESTDLVDQKVPSDHGASGIYPYIKLNIPIFKNANLTLGNYSAFDEKMVYNFDNSLYNSANNPLQSRSNFDSYINWNQKFQLNDELSIGYDLLFQYSNYHQKTESPQHGDRFFDYGYVGEFNSYKTPTYELGSVVIDGKEYNNIWLLNSWNYDTLVSFTPSNINPGLAAYTSNYFDIYQNEPYGNYQNLDQVMLGGGLLNGIQPASVYNLWNNTGTANSNYQESNDERIRFAAHVSIDYKQHQITVGGEYNKETQSNYSIDPVGLWNLARGLTNLQLHQLDLENPYPVEHEGFVDTIIYYRKYEQEVQRTFDINLRNALGLAVDGLDYILIDSYNPENNTIKYYDQYGDLKTITTPANLFNINMISNEELLNYGNSFVSYAGYSYTGQKQKESSGLYSFYSDFTVDAAETTFWTVFAEDDFNWKGLHINLGLRLDVYNANRPELNDLYCLFPINNVQEAMELGDIDFIKPANIGEDYLVYLDRLDDAQKVSGFRDGDTWYNANGTQIFDPGMLDVGNGLSPYLKYPDITQVGMSGWTPDMSFGDYKQSVNLLPQIKIDYTFFKRINVYGQYNTFTQNPVYTNEYRPDYYYYWNNITQSRVIPNPALKPMQTGKLFAGVKAMLSKCLMADVAFLTTYIDNYVSLSYIMGGYPTDYFTYTNSENRITTPGIKLNFEFVNPKNYGPLGGISLTKLFTDENDLYYRQVSSLTLNLLAGYRFDSQYNSTVPVWANSKFFRGLGGSLYYQFRKGTPYYYTGGQYGVDIQYTPNVNLFNLNIQKDFMISHRAMLNVYLTIENVFNFQNVFEVYSTTGQADDNGFLSDPSMQQYINNQTDPDSYRLQYQLKLLNPSHFDIPRIWRIGVIFKY